MYFENLIKGIPKDLAKEVFNAKVELEKDFNNSNAKRKFINAVWKLYEYLCENIEEDYEIEKRLFLRFGLLEPKYLNSEDIRKIKEIPFINQDENIFYVDEWLLAVKKGIVNPSSYIETVEKRRKVLSSNITSFQKAFEEKILKRKRLESEIKEIVNNIKDENKPYNKAVLGLIDEAVDRLKKLKQLNREIEILYEQIGDLKEKQKDEKLPQEEIKFTEHLVVKQMLNKSIGRLGNKFLVLTSIFLTGVSEIGTKDVIKRKIEKIEKIDYKVFLKNTKGVDIRFLPYFILVPGYGDYGFCWEPFEGLNFVSGRGRVVIPMFPKNLDISVIYALGDYRWKAAKELSFGHWMEEGLTGQFYNYMLDNKIKERPDEYFLKNYVLWILKESKGVQKLEKEVREIFWRYLEFPEEIKSRLANLSYVYKNLYEKDKRRKKR
ncbi:hypothetical protein SU69_07125 [Thermosipho melanesiensis]|uniref:Uncharacterized protein n=2 Tax=Thermosipho melanesiensis TaxID=46541 RepID=A6LMV3_THEM4|nr:hypothetical protein [Thermosipho melanesiensis]ABR31254.1 hypothetical protein Tmel_1407 [Thermosipho melanesiensis BI429]APT74338.1 hypothetical protein BW47_07450 [Thermosipho melanesiensis]OOC36278.1 hypothetical protein SU68_07195 [Thermosipho melanesiensis]OOC37096.1 hypothetical protein SU69_07125 [Thermosipho melanesiensis]OOC37848.1 hypothetical protein SU70_07135 [Thermosipho melanesiensis]